MNFNKGDKIHHVTVGLGGKNDVNPICEDHTSIGDFMYVQNKWFGFALVHVTDHQMTITYKSSRPVKLHSRMSMKERWGLGGNVKETNTIYVSKDLLTINILRKTD
jgi:hypothetical protein